MVVPGRPRRVRLAGKVTAMSLAESIGSGSVVQGAARDIVGRIVPDRNPVGMSRIEQLAAPYRVPWLRASARAAFGALVARCGDASGRTWVGNTRLAEEAGLSRSGLKLALAELRGLGVLVVIEEGRGAAPSVRAIDWERVRGLIEGVSVGGVAGGSHSGPGQPVARGGSPRGPGVGHLVAPIREDNREVNREEEIEGRHAAASPPAVAAPADPPSAVSAPAPVWPGPGEPGLHDRLCAWAASRLCEEARLPGSAANPAIWGSVVSLGLSGVGGPGGERLVWAGSDPLDGERMVRAAVEVGLRRAAANGASRAAFGTMARKIAAGAIRAGLESGTYPEFVVPNPVTQERLRDRITREKRAATKSSTAAALALLREQGVVVPD